jgi:hypothetical protein
VFPIEKATRPRTRPCLPEPGFAISVISDVARDGAFEFCGQAICMVDRLGFAFSHLHGLGAYRGLDVSCCEV